MNNKDLFHEAKPRILIVDDVRRNITELTGMLNSVDVAISSAMDGNQALDMAHKLLPDLVLLDIMIPGMDGIEVCRRLKQKPDTKNIPVILLTIQTEKEDILQGFQAGAADYIAKPFMQAELLARVRAHLDLKRFERLLNLYKTQVEIEKSENAALSSELVKKSRELEKMTISDDLTDLFNYKYTMKRLSQSINEARRYNYNLSIILFDIDLLKRIKNEFGHRFGEEVFIKVGAEIKRNVRESDIAGRYSGEEFLVILPHTDNGGGCNTAERIRKNVQLLTWEKENLSVTVSGGISTLSTEIPEPSAKTESVLYSLIMKADNLLFKAKENGRNRIESG